MFATQPLARLLCLGLLAIGMVGGQRSADMQDLEEVDPYAAAESEWGAADEEGIAIDAAPGVPGAVRTAPPKNAAAAKAQPAEKGRRIVRVCRVTAYCDRGQTAAGVPSGVGQCAAPSYIPLGSTVYIPELGRKFIVTDRTHKRFRHNTVDIFIPTEYSCVKFGRKYLSCEFTLPASKEHAQSNIRAAARPASGKRAG